MGPLKLDENTTFSELTKKIILKTKHNSQMKKLTDVLEVPDQRLYNLEISRCLYILSCINCKKQVNFIQLTFLKVVCSISTYPLFPTNIIYSNTLVISDKLKKYILSIKYFR